jgi:hypothetical protein
MTGPGIDRDRAMAEAAGREVRAALLRVVTAVDPDAVTVEPIFPGSQLDAQVPTPAAGLRAAVLLSRLFTGEAGRQIRRGREAGLSWAELAVLVDAADGEAAFEFAIGPGDDRWYRPSFTWRCPACAELISDHGPYESHPDDNEAGHAADCPRHVAAIAARRRTRDSWDDPGDGNSDSDSGDWSDR